MTHERTIVWKDAQDYDQIIDDIYKFNTLYVDVKKTILQFINDYDMEYFKAFEIIRVYIDRKLPILVSGDFDGMYMYNYSLCDNG